MLLFCRIVVSPREELVLDRLAPLPSLLSFPKHPWPQGLRRAVGVHEPPRNVHVEDYEGEQTVCSAGEAYTFVEGSRTELCFLSHSRI